MTGTTFKKFTDFPTIWEIQRNPWLGPEQNSSQYKLIVFLKNHPDKSRLVSVEPEFLQVELDSEGNWVDVKEIPHV